VASNVTSISCAKASYPARMTLSRQARSHWSVLGRRFGQVGGAVETVHLRFPGHECGLGEAFERPLFAASVKLTAAG